VSGIKTMIAQLRGHRPQVVIAHGERELLFASLAGRRARNNARLVFVIHNDRIESRSWVRPFSKRITRFLARRVDVVIAVSAVAARGELGSLFKTPTVAVQPPRDSGGMEPREIAGGYRFIAAGRMVPRKGFAVLLSAIGANAQIFAESDSRVTIAGDGPLLDELRNQAAALGIDQLVDFPGNIDDLADELCGSHYFLQPSQSEGAGMALLEALQSGTLAASGPVGFATEALALDPRNTIFNHVPTAGEWSRWFADTLPTTPPRLDERIARAERYRSSYDPTVLADGFYQLVFGRS
jgi:glycosyltransferase involved in cell wall biosynthesis